MLYTVSVQLTAQLSKKNATTIESAPVLYLVLLRTFLFFKTIIFNIL